MLEREMIAANAAKASENVSFMSIIAVMAILLKKGKEATSPPSTRLRPFDLTNGLKECVNEMLMRRHRCSYPSILASMLASTKVSLTLSIGIWRCKDAAPSLSA